MTSDDVFSSYFAKRDFLDERFTRVSARDFYRELFPESSFERMGNLQDKRPNGIITEIGTSTSDGAQKAHRYLVFDDLEEINQFIGSDRFAIMAPIGYSGKKRTLKNAYTLFALTFDLDEPNLLNFFHQVRGGVHPMPTFTILSGHGVHLYYQFEEPQPLYPRNMTAFKLLKEALTPQIWNMHTSSIPKPQYQGINQGFRIVGSASKLGVDYPVLAWRSGAPTSISELLDYVVLEKEKIEQIQSVLSSPTMTWQEAEEKYPQWARNKKHNMSPRWHVKRGLYDWWKTKAESSSFGHRYFYLMCLAIYAKKCDVPRSELRQDMDSLIPILNAHGPANEPVTHVDINAAMKAYDDKNNVMPRDTIAHLTAIPIPKNRRNHRPQKQHMEIMSAVRDVVHPNGSWRDGNGRKPKKDIVQKWRADNPNGRKIDCERETGLSRPTVLKWWNAE